MKENLGSPPHLEDYGFLGGVERKGRVQISTPNTIHISIFLFSNISDYYIWLKAELV